MLHVPCAGPYLHITLVLHCTVDPWNAADVYDAIMLITEEHLQFSECNKMLVDVVIFLQQVAHNPRYGCTLCCSNGELSGT